MARRSGRMASGAMAALLLAGPLSLTSLGAAPAAAAEPLELLEIQPLTGNAAAYGKWSTPATDIAVAEINAAGGIAGHPVKVIREDNQTNPRVGVQTLQRVLASHAVIGATSMNSSVVIAMDQVAAARHVTILNTGAQAEAVGGHSRWLVSNIPSIAAEVRSIVQFGIETKHYHRFAVVSPDDSLGQSARELFKKEAAAQGAEIIEDEVHPLGEQDYTAIIARLKSAAPDAILVGTYGLDAPVLLNQLKQFGITLPLLSTSGFATSGTLANPGAAGAFYTQIVYEHPEALERKYRERTGEGLNLYAVNAYEAVYIYAELARRLLEASHEVTAQAINDAFWAKPSFTTPLGPVAFDARGVVQRKIAIYQVTEPPAIRLVLTLS